MPNDYLETRTNTRGFIWIWGDGEWYFGKYILRSVARGTEVNATLESGRDGEYISYTNSSGLTLGGRRIVAWPRLDLAVRPQCVPR